jgi:hypothetical protein
VSSPSAPPTDLPSDALSGSGGGSAFADHRSGAEPSIDLTAAGPPPEVLEQMARADAINTRLRASGRQLSFALSADGCSLQIELRDTEGNLLRILSAEEAIEIAAGGESD